jgi:hypothetical protein
MAAGTGFLRCDSLHRRSCASLWGHPPATFLAGPGTAGSAAGKWDTAGRSWTPRNMIGKGGRVDQAFPVFTDAARTERSFTRH